MISSFRRLSKSTVGTAVMALILILIIAGFAMGDIQSVLSGGGFGGQSGTLAKAGSERVTDREMSRTMERRLSQVRQQNPNADYSTLAAEFDQLLGSLIDSKVVQAFANKFGLTLSKRLVDAQIAQIPGTKGLTGQFSDQAYQAWLAQQRLTDEEVRSAIGSDILQQLLLTPVAVNGRAPLGMATPYASMLLEVRQGQVAFVPLAAFRSALKPTDADLQTFYAANRARYMIPEQRVLRIARIGPDQVASVQASEAEIAAYYNANEALYAPKETRVISQAVVAGQPAAQAIASKLRAGSSFVDAAKPAGLSAEDISVGPQTKQQFTELAGAAVANATFAAADGAIVGPVRSDLGWHVVKVESIRREGGKPLAAVRGEIATKLNAEKRNEAIEALVDQVQNAIDGGASFSEAVAAAKLPVAETPAITAAGTSLADPSYRLPPELAPAVKTGFELAENDEPVIDTLPGAAGYALVAPARVIAAAPAPLAGIRDRVAQDWTTVEAGRRARALAQGIAAKAARAALSDAAKGSPVSVPVEPITARRLELSRFQGRVPPALGLLFSLGQGKARMVPGAQGEGFYVVKVDKIVPGNALSAPGLIGRTQVQLQDTLSQEYAQQFLASMRAAVGVTRNEEAIAETKRRITSPGS